MSTEKLLEERGGKYGEYFDNARTMQAIKAALRTGVNWESCPDIVKETLECLALKMGRIVNGDPTYDDNWKDIIGYTQLVLDRLGKLSPDNPERHSGPAITDTTIAEALGIIGHNPVVPRREVTYHVPLHLTNGDIGVPFLRQDGHSVILTVNEGSHPEVYPYMAAGIRYTATGTAAFEDVRARPGMTLIKRQREGTEQAA